MADILGISAFYHDSAAVFVRDGEIVAAAQEERFSRKKHDASFPFGAVKYCLEESNTPIGQVDFVAFYDKPLLKFERLLETYLIYAPKGLRSFIAAMPVWIKDKLFLKDLILKELSGISDSPKFKFNPEKVLFSEHHLSHAASAFFPSNFEAAAILTIDGVGEWATTCIGIGQDNKINLFSEIDFPHSLGLLYSAFTYYTGFKVNSAEYKVMGLAPYGEPKYVNLILDNLIDLKDDGSFRLNMEYFDYCTGFRMISKKFEKLFGGHPRKSETALIQKEMDIARSIQEVTEMAVLRLARQAVKVAGSKNLCLAGGVALNCVANGRILKETEIENIWIQPASGDAGGALGAALLVWYSYLGNTRRVNHSEDSMKGAFLGPKFDNKIIEKFLKESGASYEKLDDEALIERVSDLIAQEKVIGWFCGRMEFGPRALGARSIIGDARSPRLQSVLNLKIKFRESFRPFAPSVLKEDAENYFDLACDSPYMLLVAPLKNEIRKNIGEEDKIKDGFNKLKVIRSSIPAVTHVDYSARVQTVSENMPNQRYYALVKKFSQQTGCSVIINTSFNVRGEPIVCSPHDAFNCFMRTDMDYLVMENLLLDKTRQKPVDKKDKSWMKEFILD
ncbi:MAG: carbamoyltransferase [Candidatus Omnitrophota bacterium]|nr:carbamoyltransferase [Candidatus Omnitrophota bacterium]